MCDSDVPTSSARRRLPCRLKGAPHDFGRLMSGPAARSEIASRSRRNSRPISRGVISRDLAAKSRPFRGSALGSRDWPIAEVTVAGTIRYSHWVQRNRAAPRCSGEIEHGRIYYVASGYSKLERARRNRSIFDLKIIYSATCRALNESSHSQRCSGVSVQDKHSRLKISDDTDLRIMASNDISNFGQSGFNVVLQNFRGGGTLDGISR